MSQFFTTWFTYPIAKSRTRYELDEYQISYIQDYYDEARHTKKHKYKVFNNWTNYCAPTLSELGDFDIAFAKFFKVDQKTIRKARSIRGIFTPKSELVNRARYYSFNK
jgi:hypothetical protein